MQPASSPRGPPAYFLIWSPNKKPSPRSENEHLPLAFRYEGGWEARVLRGRGASKRGPPKTGAVPLVLLCNKEISSKDTRL